MWKKNRATACKIHSTLQLEQNKSNLILFITFSNNFYTNLPFLFDENNEKQREMQLQKRF